MNFQAHLVWLATARLGDAPAESSAFNVLGQRGLFGQFAIGKDLAIDPLRFQPTVGFHEWVTHRLFGGRSARRPPYETFSVDGSIGVTIQSVSASVFPGEIAVVQVAATAEVTASDQLNLALANLQNLRSSKEIPTVRALISLTLDRLNGNRSGGVGSGTYDDYFLMLVELPPAKQDFAQLVDELRADMVGLLIGTEDPETLTRDVIDRTLSANAELNSKSRNDLMLLNRKGVLIVRPNGPYRGPHVDRLAKTRDLAIIGQFSSAYLRGIQTGAITRDLSAVVTIQRIRDWVEQPELTFFSSYSHTLTWIGLSKEILLRRRLAAASGSAEAE